VGTVGLLLTGQTCIYNVFVVSITIPLATAVSIDVSNAAYVVSSNRIVGEIPTATIGYLYSALTGTAAYNDFEASMSGIATEVSGSISPQDTIRAGPPWRQRTGAGGYAPIAGYVDNEANPRVQLTYSALSFGPGGGVAVDTNVYRYTNDLLATDDGFITGRFTTVQRDALAALDGTLLYNSDTKRFNARGEVNYWDWLMTALRRGQFGELTAAGDTTAVAAEGLYWGNATGILGAFSGPTESANGFYDTYTSGAVVGNQAGWYTGAVHSRRLAPTILIKFQFQHNTDQRAYVGLADVALTTVIGADNPASGLIGVQQPAGNAWWRFIYKTAAGGTVHVHGTIAADTSVHYLRITFLDTPTVLVEILSAAFALEDSDTTVLDLPATSLALRACQGVEVTAGAAARALNLYFARGVNNTV